MSILGARIYRNNSRTLKVSIEIYHSSNKLKILITQKLRVHIYMISSFTHTQK